MAHAEVTWNGQRIPKGWSLAPGERFKIEDPDLPPGLVTPWNVEWGDIPPGFVLCDGNQGTPDLQHFNDGLVIYIQKTG